MVYSLSRLLRKVYFPTLFSCIRFNSWEVGHLVIPAKQNPSVETDIVNYGSDGVYFAAYSSNGFILNTGIQIYGPCAAFPRNSFSWNIRDSLDIDEEALSLFFVLEPRLDVLIIGKGETNAKINHKFIFDLCQKYNLPVDILPTQAAIGTFNFLNSEGRYVAAGLIPPRQMDVFPQLIPPDAMDLLSSEAEDTPLLLGEVFHTKDKQKLLGRGDGGRTDVKPYSPKAAGQMPQSPLATVTRNEKAK